VQSPIAVTVWLLVAAILIAGFLARRRAAFAEAMAQESSLYNLGQDIATVTVRSLSLWERVGVRGYGLSIFLNPSPGASRRLLPKGEVK
jgi:hypothetical protein